MPVTGEPLLLSDQEGGGSTSLILPVGTAVLLILLAIVIPLWKRSTRPESYVASQRPAATSAQQSRSVGGSFPSSTPSRQAAAPTVAPTVPLPAYTPTITPTPPPLSTSTPQPTPTATATPVILRSARSPGDFVAKQPGQDLVGSGLSIALQPGSGGKAGEGTMVVGVMNAEGSPLSDVGVTVFQQDRDLNNNPTWGKESAGGRTDGGGRVRLNVAAGLYGLRIGGLNGYAWGDPWNFEVRAGYTTTVQMALGKLRVGIAYADGKPAQDIPIWVHLQKLDVNNNPTLGEEAGFHRTDNAGLATFTFTPGVYAIRMNLPRGYPWDRLWNYPVQNSSAVEVRVTLGRLVIKVRNATGGPLADQPVWVYTQKPDLNGKPIRDAEVFFSRSDSSGVLSIDLTEGTYAVRLADTITTMDVAVKQGMITTWDMGKLETLPGSPR